MNKIKISKLQKEILLLLREGNIMTIDQQNMAWIGNRPIQPQTRYFLTDNSLITRLDKIKSVKIKGNGFVISKRGLDLLESD